MNSPQRIFAFLAALFITFGISALDTNNLDYEHNTKSFIAIGIGFLLVVFFVINKLRNS